MSEVLAPATHPAVPSSARAPQRLLTFAPYVVALGLPLLLNDYWTYSLGVSFANAIGVLAVAMLVRFGGEVSIGHSVFLATGAYTVGIMDSRLGLSAMVSLPLAVAFGAILGIAFAFPSRRLSGIYLAVTTLALALALPEIILAAGPVAGGFEGLYVAQAVVPGVPNTLQRYYFALILLMLAVAVLARLRNSRQGLALLVARSHPAAAEAFGVSRNWARLGVMGLSGALGGLSGAALAFTSSTVSPNSFTMWTSIFLLVGAVVGLYDLSLIGALVGGLFVTLVPQVLAGAGDWIPVLYGVALLGVILAARFVPALRRIASA